MTNYCLTVVTGPGAPGVAACDAFLEAGLEMATLGAATAEKLSEILPLLASWRNPIDMTGSSATNPEIVWRTVRIWVKTG